MFENFKEGNLITLKLVSGEEVLQSLNQLMLITSVLTKHWY